MIKTLFFLSLLIACNECGVILLTRGKPIVFYTVQLRPRPDFNPLPNDEFMRTTTKITTPKPSENVNFKSTSTTVSSTSSEDYDEQETILTSSTISNKNQETVTIMSLENDDKKTTVTVGTISEQNSTEITASTISGTTSIENDDEQQTKLISSTISDETESTLANNNDKITTTREENTTVTNFEQSDITSTTVSLLTTLYVTSSPSTTHVGTTSDAFDGLGSGSGDDEDTEESNIKDTVTTVSITSDNFDGSGSGDDTVKSSIDAIDPFIEGSGNNKEEEIAKAKVVKSVLDDDFVFVDETKVSSFENSQSNEDFGSGSGDYYVVTTNKVETSSTLKYDTIVPNVLPKNITNSTEEKKSDKTDNTNLSSTHYKNDTKEKDSLSEPNNDKIPFEVIPPEILEINRDNIDEDYFLIIDGFANPSRNSANITNKHYNTTEPKAEN